MRERRSWAAGAMCAALALAGITSGCVGPTRILARGSVAQSVTPLPRARHREGAFAGWDGTRLFEQSWQPTGTPRGVLVIVHGLKDHSSRYTNAALALQARGYAVHAFDLRGHGHSDGERAYVRYFEEYLADLEIFLSRVRRAEPGAPLFLFGHSMGGAIVTRYAMQHPHADIQGLLLSAAALEVTPDVGGFLIGITRVLGRMFPHLRVMDLPDSGFSRDPQVVHAMTVDPMVEHREGPAREAAQLLINIDRIQQGMEQIRYPFLVMHGTADRITNPHGSRELDRRAQSTDKVLKLYDGYVHDLLHEPGGDVVLGDIVTWLDAHTPR